MPKNNYGSHAFKRHVFFCSLSWFFCFKTNNSARKDIEEFSCKVHQRFCIFRALLFSLITWKQKPHNKFERKVEKFFALFSHPTHSSMCSALNARILALDRKTFQNFSFSNFVFLTKFFFNMLFVCCKKVFQKKISVCQGAGH